MGLIVSITLVLGLIFYWEGRRLYKEPEEHSKLQRIAITIKLGGISYLKSLFMLACLIAPAVIMYLICLLYTSPSPRDMRRSRMPSSA